MKRLKNGFTVWFTGLSGAGKTTIADLVYKKLSDDTYIYIERLDGDNLRKTLTKDLGFSKQDRDTNLERVGYVASLLSHNAVGVLSSFITPYIQQRETLQKHCKNYIEVFIDTPLTVCEERDTKGLYKKTRKGEIKNFTGISDPYETPVSPKITIYTENETPEESCNKLMQYLEVNGYLETL